MTCTHLDTVRNVMPSSHGCEDCLKIGDDWVHLRVCRSCGHVGCCDSSKNQHATKHYRATGHPIMQPYDPPGEWGWCYIDQEMLDFTDNPTPHRPASRAPRSSRVRK